MAQLRPLLTLLAGLFAACVLPASAQSTAGLNLAVSEGTSGGIDAATARKKYAPLAERCASGAIKISAYCINPSACPTCRWWPPPR